MKIKNKRFIRILTALLLVFCIVGTYALVVNFYVIISQDKKIISGEALENMTEVDYIMVLGCGVKNGEPSDMLRDRLLETVNVSELHKNAKIIVSGDNSGETYNEVGVMKKFLIEKGVDEARIIEDNIGYSTYESIHNLKVIYKAEKPIVITQKFHVWRALYIAESLKLEAKGVAASPINFTIHFYSSAREVLARNKDFIKCQINGECECTAVSV